MAWLALRNDLPPMEDSGPILLSIVGVLSALIVITTACRIYVRVINRVFGWDDGMILMAVAFSLGRLIIQIKQSQYGNGKHRAYLTAHQYMMINMYGWYGQIFLFMAVAFLKVSIGFLILRIKNTKVFKILVYTMMVGVCITNFGVVIILLAECRPAGFWRGASAKCWPSKIRIYSIYATIAFSVTTDLLLSILPFFIVWHVKIPMKLKVSVCGLMSLGIVATGFGVARAASLGLITTDLSWTYCIAAIWSNLELFLGIIAANLAIARSTYGYLFGKNRPSYVSNDSLYLSPPTMPPSAHSYQLRGDRDRFEPTNTIVDARIRRPSDTRSSQSESPLVPGIQKKTEFWLSEEELEMQNRRK